MGLLTGEMRVCTVGQAREGVNLSFWVGLHEADERIRSISYS